jgi:hypothetical protein
MHRFSGLDGKLYMVSKGDAVMERYDPELKKWFRVVGGQSQGQCPDGTPVSTCPVQISDAFVTRDGQVFFVDSGTIRTIVKNSTNQDIVMTVFGQSKAFGDGQVALSARFNKIKWIDKKANGKVVVADYREHKIREFLPGGTIASIAGNGMNQDAKTGDRADTTPISLENWDSGPVSLVVQPGSNDVIVAQWNTVLKLSDGVGSNWIRLGGQGGTDWKSGDGRPMTELSFPYVPMTFGAGSNLLLTVDHSWDGSQPIDVLMKMFSLSSGVFTQKNLLGSTGPASGILCNAGVEVSTCKSVYENSVNRATWDEKGQRWLVSAPGANALNIYIFPVDGGGKVGIYQLPSQPSSFAYLSDATASVSNPSGTLYYCGVDGGLHAVDAPSWPGVDHAPGLKALLADDARRLSFPSPAIKCTGASLIYDESGGVRRLIFPITQNGLTGVAEYQL